MEIDEYSYRVIWSAEDREHVGLCAEFPSLSWLAPSREEAMAGIRELVGRLDLGENDEGEPVGSPSPC